MEMTDGSIFGVYLACAESLRILGIFFFLFPLPQPHHRYQLYKLLFWFTYFIWVDSSIQDDSNAVEMNRIERVFVELLGLRYN